MTTMIVKAVHAIHALEYPGLGFTACEQIARAVLTAIREPDEAMLEAGDDWQSHHIWMNMIDSILAEEPTRD